MSTPEAQRNASADEALFAALAKHPRHTLGVGSHPLPDRTRVEGLFDWDAVASELGGGRGSKDALDETFGAVKGKGQGRPGLLQTRVRRVGPKGLRDPLARSRLGVLVIPNFVKEAEEADILVHAKTEVHWEPRVGGGYHASFGPTFLPDSGYQVDRTKAFTALPGVLDSVKARAEKLLESPALSESAFMKACCESDSLVWESCGPGPELLLEARRALAEFAMSPSTRAGRQGPLSQAFLQRYESSAQSDEAAQSKTQALGMHFDSRSANGEVVVGLSLGEDDGHIFFSRSGPAKGQPFPLSLAKDLEDRGEGILVQLPRRALYLFFGFARFHLRHGVPWHNPAAPGCYQRVTVTFRSVPVPRGQKRHADEGEGKQCKQLRLHDMLDSFAFRGAKRARLVPFPGALNLGLLHNVRDRECIDIDSSDCDSERISKARVSRIYHREPRAKTCTQA